MAPRLRNVERCPVCRGASSAPVLRKNGYTISRCVGCGSFHVTPMPTDEVLYAHYQDLGYFSGQGEQGYVSYADMAKALLPHFRRRLAAIDGAVARGKLLDFGCAAGYFLQLAQADGWRVAGVELSREIAQTTARQLGVPVASSVDELPEGSFDAITLWDVLEHVPEPVRLLCQLRDSLRPGGLLMLSTPNAGHWQALSEPDQWEALRPPSHLVLFTARALGRALREAGFEDASIRGALPLPRLPGWLRRATSGLQRNLAIGRAPAWSAALLAWRAVRLVGWGWQRLAGSEDDVYTTLEAIALKRR
jgi:SAM-dependent methyltransferase